MRLAEQRLVNLRAAVTNPGNRRLTLAEDLSLDMLTRLATVVYQSDTKTPAEEMKRSLSMQMSSPCDLWYLLAVPHSAHTVGALGIISESHIFAKGLRSPSVDGLRDVHTCCMYLIVKREP